MNIPRRTTSQRARYLGMTMMLKSVVWYYYCCCCWTLSLSPETNARPQGKYTLHLSVVVLSLSLLGSLGISQKGIKCQASVTINIPVGYLNSKKETFLVWTDNGNGMTVWCLYSHSAPFVLLYLIRGQFITSLFSP